MNLYKEQDIKLANIMIVFVKFYFVILNIFLGHAFVLAIRFFGARVWHSNGDQLCTTSCRFIPLFV